MPGFRGGRSRRRKVCPFTVAKATHIDHQDVAALRAFLSGTGKSLPRRVTGVGARYQRTWAAAIRLARHVALLPTAQR
ncbi:MAG: 30S ribosomal protein S18 [Candidatus Sericytochromatia bacterium]|nr:30S ribosomal protein S18 [Candidatus Sericytochromatia bacterium]